MPPDKKPKAGAKSAPRKLQAELKKLGSVVGEPAETRAAWIGEALGRLQYGGMSREEKGAVRLWLQKATGYSRAQIARYITAYNTRTGAGVPAHGPAGAPVDVRACARACVAHARLCAADPRAGLRATRAYARAQAGKAVRSLGALSGKQHLRLGLTLLFVAGVAGIGSSEPRLTATLRFLSGDQVAVLPAASDEASAVLQTQGGLVFDPAERRLKAPALHGIGAIAVTRTVTTEGGQPLYREQDTYITDGERVLRSRAPRDLFEAREQRLMRRLIRDGAIPVSEFGNASTGLSTGRTRLRSPSSDGQAEGIGTEGIGVQMHGTADEPGAGVAGGGSGRTAVRVRTQTVKLVGSDRELVTALQSLQQLLRMGSEGQVMMMHNGKAVWRSMPYLHGAGGGNLNTTGGRNPDVADNPREYRSFGGGAQPPPPPAPPSGHDHQNDGGGGVLDISRATTGVLPSDRGGLGLRQFNPGDLLVGATGNALGRVSLGTQGYVLMASGSTVQWASSGTVAQAAGWADDGAIVRLVQQADRVSVGSTSGTSKLTVSGAVAIGQNYVSLTAPLNGLIIEGNVGIGSSNPQAKLSVAGTMSGRSLFVSGTGSSPLLITSVQTGRVGIGTASPKASLHVIGSGAFTGSLSGASLAIQSTGTFLGNVGIGTSKAPVQKLEVAGVISGSTLFLGAGGATSPALAFNNDTDSGLYWISANVLGFSTGGAERVRIDGSGNVGIGTTNTGTAKFSVAGTLSGSALAILNPGSMNSILGNMVLGGTTLSAVSKGRLTVYGSGAFTASMSGNTILVQSGGYIRGRLAIGKTTPLSALDVVGTISGSVVTATALNVTGLTQGSVVFIGSNGALNQSNAQFFWNTATAQLGLGTATPKAKLHVVGSGAFTSFLSGAYLTIQGGDTTILGNTSIGKTGAGLAKLDVVGTISGSALVINGTSTLNGTVTINGGSALNMPGGNAAITMGGNSDQIIASSNAGFLQLQSYNGVTALTTTATNTAFRVRGAASQSANLQEWQNSAGTVLSSVGFDGKLAIKQAGAAKAALHVIGSGAFTGSMSGNTILVQSGGYIRGRLGIGPTKTAPLAALDVVGTVSGSRLQINHGGASIGTTLTDGNRLVISDILQYTNGGGSATTWHTGVSGGDYIVVESGVAEHLRFKATTGNVGIGKTAPNAKLDVVGTISGSTLQINGAGTFLTDITVSGGDITGAGGAALDLGESTAGDVTVTGDLIVADDSFLGISSSAGRIVFDDQGTDEINILSARLGVGTSAPTTALDVVGTISGSALTLNGPANNSYILGNLSIGKTGAGLAKLDVVGTISGDVGDGSDRLQQHRSGDDSAIAGAPRAGPLRDGRHAAAAAQEETEERRRRRRCIRGRAHRGHRGGRRDPDAGSGDWGTRDIARQRTPGHGYPADLQDHDRGREDDPDDRGASLFGAPIRLRCSCRSQLRPASRRTSVSGSIAIRGSERRCNPLRRRQHDQKTLPGIALLQQFGECRQQSRGIALGDAEPDDGERRSRGEQTEILVVGDNHALLPLRQGRDGRV
ncbi:MAG: TonB-dependent receptor [Candidatus Peregrinibacteria bacterium Greene0416_19]|nr:MAG: TonB-dependent receptor [Candidatus Peregrinibacteria bacterium Greene0416_19]